MPVGKLNDNVDAAYEYNRLASKDEGVCNVLFNSVSADSKQTNDPHYVKSLD